MTPAQNYRDTLEELYSLQKYGIKFGLSQTRNLLKGLGNPEAGQNFLHIGGSNGKGSVGCFLQSALNSCGYKVGLFTSPHLVSFRERFQVNGKQISTQEVVHLYRELQEVVDQQEPPTFFEAVTAMALAFFSRQQTDITIMEVGMGGRLDATNLISPLLSIITNISLEHQEFLGNTLLEVATEKAGIIKENAPLLTGATDGEVLELFQRTCRQAGTTMYQLECDYTYQAENSGISFRGVHLQLNHVQLAMLGEHQRRNAALALAGLDILKGFGWNVGPECVPQGLARAIWPGRLHLVRETPRTIVDGAHNPAAMQELAAAVEKEISYRRLILVLGIMQDKEATPVLQSILPQAHHIIFTRCAYSRAMDPEQLLHMSPGPLPSHEVQLSLEKALERSRDLACSDRDLVLICGSLYLVGEALSILNPQSYPPEL